MGLVQNDFHCRICSTIVSDINLVMLEAMGKVFRCPNCGKPVVVSASAVQEDVSAT